MAYDFYFGKSREEAMYASHSFAIVDYDHDAIFEKIEDFIDKKWIFFRMHDFYGEAIISLQEIPSLIKEIDLIIPKISNKTHTNLLKDLKSVCEKSLERKVVKSLLDCI